VLRRFANSITQPEFSLSGFVDNLAYLTFQFVFDFIIGKNHGSFDDHNSRIIRCLCTEGRLPAVGGRDKAKSLVIRRIISHLHGAVGISLALVL
jgi:hypothetical protein